MMPERKEQRAALVFSGGVGLGAYQAGCYAVLQDDPGFSVEWLAGSSVGGVNAALIAGNAAADCIERLKLFWRFHGAATGEEGRDANPLLGPWRHFHSWMSAAGARLLGSPGHFVPRYLSGPYERFSGLYDLRPMRDSLAKLIDFERLNSGEMRLSIAATDIESGELVIFDTAKGDRIGLDHLLASCGFLPEFAPLEIGGRLLGDGGLCANAPIEAVLDENADDLVCIVLDLYARDGPRPSGLESALARKGDLVFGNQTMRRLEAYGRAFALRGYIAETAKRLTAKARQDPALKPALRAAADFKTTILYLSYRAPLDEAGPEKAFDMSSSTIASRWETGAADMREGLATLDRAGRHGDGASFQLHVIRREEDRRREHARAAAGRG
jgi:NTE family protein